MLLQNLLGALLLCSSFGNSWVFPLDSPPPNTLLAVPNSLKRNNLFSERQSNNDCQQNDLDPDAPLCSVICAASSDSCSKSPIDRRYLHAQQLDRRRLDTLKGHNEALLGLQAGNDTATNQPQKRVFNVLTQDQITTYVPDNVYNEGADATFGAPIPLVTTEVFNGQSEVVTLTVTEQRQFPGAAFQIGTGPLIGCTVVIIVSARAVHAGHYWEDPGWLSNDNNVFSQNVLNWFSGTGNQVGVGPALNPSLFNAADDNTRVFIMVPRSDSLPDDPTSLQYRKVTRLISTIKAVLPNANYLRWGYARVQAPNSPEGIQGTALFQFDPNGFGTGQEGWRVFLEQNVFRSDDPQYPSSAVNGIQSYNVQGAG